ncbi:MAG: 4a-hydroxytetrahydrobiopterin dehydratase [Candidatus Nanohaloarchaea archaeon]
MPEEPLSDQEVESRLEKLEIWGLKDSDLLGQRLVTRVEFEEYQECVRFANELFGLEVENTPEVKVMEDAVAVDVSTGEVNGFTENDFEVAEKIEEKLREGDWS